MNDSSVDKITRLFELHKAGKISLEEYNLLKKKLLHESQSSTNESVINSVSEVTEEEDIIIKEVTVKNDESEGETLSINEKISASRNARKSRSLRIVIISIIAICIILTILFLLYKHNSSITKNKNFTPPKEPIIIIQKDESDINKKPTLQFFIGKIKAYYTDIESKTFNANNYFAPKILRYYTKENITPYDINNSLNSYYNEFIKPKMTLDVSSFKLNDEIENIFEINYDAVLDVYRKSKSKYEYAEVNYTLLFNNDFKIFSLTEKINFLKFSENPRNTDNEIVNRTADNVSNKNQSNNENKITSVTLKRDPRAKDVANVFWDTKYNLYCKLTDEPIYPNENGEYDIWFASNEEPYPHHKILTKQELSSLLFYKFKDYETCKKWCDEKKGN